MAYILIDGERCKGCELCLEFCPKGLIKISEEFNSKGFRPVKPVDGHEEKCSGCLACAMMCPDVAIEVYRQ